MAQTIQSDPDQYSDAILGMPRDQYISTIQKSSSWGGAIELAILSTVHQVEIAAIDIQSSVWAVTVSLAAQNLCPLTSEPASLRSA